MGQRPTSLRHLQARGSVGSRKPSKYRNKKVVFDGIKFDSIRECNRYQELSLLERTGAIRELRCQVRIPLTASKNPVRSKKGRQLAYVVDFKYWDVTERRMRYEDVKGYDTRLSALKVAVVEAESGIMVEIVR